MQLSPNQGQSSEVHKEVRFFSPREEKPLLTYRPQAAAPSASPGVHIPSVCSPESFQHSLVRLQGLSSPEVSPVGLTPLTPWAKGLLSTALDNQDVLIHPLP